MTVFQSALYQTTSTVIETPSCVLVVDPTWLPHEVADIRSYVDQVRRERPLYLLFTHSDWDHILAYRAFPDAVTIGSGGLANHPDKEGVLERIRQFDAEHYIRRPYELAYPEIDVVVHHDGQQLTLGDTTLTFYLAPGHTPCGIFSVVAQRGRAILLAGDYLSDVEIPFLSDSSERYEDTMRKAAQIFETHPVDLLVPGHGLCTADRDEMRLRQQQSLTYIETLRAFVRSGEADTEASNQLQAIMQAYPFARGLRAPHQENLALVRHELGRSPASKANSNAF
ncbi:MBL fold metallo-hydrolase [Alicyclobacillus cycloheptanicus]|nr:MBL fold metallo-hydrolase [Alicyclobacillus cycloheptanicus]